MGVMHLFLANGAYDQQRLETPPPLDELSNLVQGVPEVVPALFQGRQCQLVIREGAGGEPLPVNAQASALHAAWAAREGRARRRIRGHAVLLDGVDLVELPPRGGR